MTEKNNLPEKDPEKPQTEKFGRGMLIIFWLLVITGLTFMLSRVEEEQYNPNREFNSEVNPSYNKLTLKRNRMGHYIVKGSINGAPATFFLDTGATVVSIPQKLARTFQLTAGRKYPTNTANGVINVSQTRIDNLSIGPIKLKDIQGAINPGMEGEEILLGMSVLKDLEFTQKGNELTLIQYR